MTKLCIIFLLMSYSTYCSANAIELYLQSAAAFRGVKLLREKSLTSLVASINKISSNKESLIIKEFQSEGERAVLVKSRTAPSNLLLKLLRKAKQDDWNAEATFSVEGIKFKINKSRIAQLNYTSEELAEVFAWRVNEKIGYPILISEKNHVTFISLANKDLLMWAKANSITIDEETISKMLNQLSHDFSLRSEDEVILLSSLGEIMNEPDKMIKEYNQTSSSFRMMEDTFKNLRL